jgi:hypothetical protein
VLIPTYETAMLSLFELGCRAQKVRSINVETKKIKLGANSKNVELTTTMPAL